MIQGWGDIAAIAAGAGQFPYLALARDGETVVEAADGGTRPLTRHGSPGRSGPPIAWFPETIGHITTHPNGRCWADTIGNYLCLFTLENALPPSGD